MIYSTWLEIKRIYNFIFATSCVDLSDIFDEGIALEFYEGKKTNDRAI